MSDTKTNKPQPGNMVVLRELPPGLLDDLCEEDGNAMTEIVGKPILLVEYDDKGRAELEFTDRAGVIHFIYVGPEFITTV